MGITTAIRYMALMLMVCSTPLAQTEQRSVSGLIFDLEHPEATRRKEAAQTLGLNQVREAVPALVKATEDPDTAVRLEVAKALVQINDTRALQAFIALTRDPDTAIQKVAIQGIVEIYVREPVGFVDGVKKVVDFLNPLSDGYNPQIVETYVPVSDEAVLALGDLLFSGDRTIRQNAATALGILRGSKANSAIADALEKETDNGVKVELIRAVYKIGDPVAAEAVIPLIRDPDKKVHDEAIVTVGRLRVKPAVKQLNEMYRAGVEERKKMFGVVPVSGKDDLQRKLLEALSFIGDSSSLDVFEEALGDERDFYRRYGAEGIGRVGDTSYVNLMAKSYFRESSKEVKLAISFALFSLGREEHLLELIGNISDSQCYYYLLELTPDRVRLLYPYTQSEKKDTALRLIDVIGLRGDNSAKPVIEEFTRSEDPDFVSPANLALRRLAARNPRG